jgi:hypothetical protein
MPPRLNKRQQRELEELNALGGSGGVSPVDTVSEDDAPAQAHAQSAFAAVRVYPSHYKPIVLNVHSSL